MTWIRTTSGLVILAGMLELRLDARTQDAPPPESVEAGKTQPQIPFKVGGKVSPPRVIFDPEPEYPPEARRAGYQGVCVLWLVVEADGRPRDIRVARSLGMGLDEKAIEAVRKWRFEPARKDGKPVAVQINIEVNFHLYDEPVNNFSKVLERAENGYAEAQLKVAPAFLASPALEDQRRGMTLLTRAANQGLRKAQYLMAERFYLHPASGAPDYVSAYTWYSLARRAGEKKSDKPLKELTSKMTPEQLAEAQARVDSWKPTSSK